MLSSRDHNPTNPYTLVGGRANRWGVFIAHLHLHTTCIWPPSMLEQKSRPYVAKIKTIFAFKRIYVGMCQTSICTLIPTIYLCLCINPIIRTYITPIAALSKNQSNQLPQTR